MADAASGEKNPRSEQQDLNLNEAARNGGILARKAQPRFQRWDEVEIESGRQDTVISYSLWRPGLGSMVAAAT
jgi:hypothetical protein